MGGELIRRATLDEIDGYRRLALERYGRAYDALSDAHKAADGAVPGGHLFNMPSLVLDRGDFPARDRDEFVAAVRRRLDKAVWSHLLAATGLDKLMDKQAKDEFRAQIEQDPPEATADNCRATLERLVEDRAAIFNRGLANAFSKLDRRFRSHDGFKIGARMVLSSMLGPDGWWNHWRRHDDTLIDVERVFSILDGKSQPERDGGIVGAVKLAKQAAGLSSQAGQFEAENDYFRVKVFGNGNAHVWFKRDDLLERVNQLLAEHFGAALGAGADVADRPDEPNRAPARNLGFFETPEPVVHRLIEAAGIGCYAGVAPKLILEPSAGLGRIAKPALAVGHHVTCVEIHPERAAALRGLPGLKRVICGDFFDQTPTQLGKFDAIAMNPPFDRWRDVDHVTHAMQFLAPGGQLAAVMAASVEFREDRKAAAFRATVERFCGRFFDLPPGSFAESGTNVNTVIVTLRAPAESERIAA